MPQGQNYDKKILLQTMEQKIFSPFFAKKLFENQNFYSSGIEPTLLNLIDRTGSVLDHLAIACGLFFLLGGNGLYM
jgi:hypothetical protein